MLSFKTELKLNNKQRTMMAKHAGVSRHAYNWGLATCLKALEDQVKLPSAIDLHKKLVAEIKTVNQWYYKVNIKWIKAGLESALTDDFSVVNLPIFLCKFKAVLTPLQMNKDAWFTQATDQSSYGETVIKQL